MLKILFYTYPSLTHSTTESSNHLVIWFNLLLLTDLGTEFCDSIIIFSFSFNTFTSFSTDSTFNLSLNADGDKICEFLTSSNWLNLLFNIFS